MNTGNLEGVCPIAHGATGPQRGRTDHLDSVTLVKLGLGAACPGLCAPLQKPLQEAMRLRDRLARRAREECPEHRCLLSAAPRPSGAKWDDHPGCRLGRTLALKPPPAPQAPL